MKIGNVYGVDPPKKLDTKRSVDEIRQKKADKAEAQPDRVKQELVAEDCSEDL